MKMSWHLIMRIGDKNMWKLLMILNLIVVIFLVEFSYSWNIVERLIFYTYGIFTIVYIFKIPDWKPYFLVKRDRVKKFTLKDLITKIIRTIQLGRK